MLPEIMALQRMIRDRERLDHEYKRRGGAVGYKPFYEYEEAEVLREYQKREEEREYEAMLEEQQFERMVYLSNLEYEYFSFPAEE